MGLIETYKHQKKIKQEVRKWLKIAYVYDASYGSQNHKELLHPSSPALIQNTGSFGWHSGYIKYMKEGRMHRLDGPAHMDTSGVVSYWLFGELVTKEQFEDPNYVAMAEIANTDI